MEITVFAKKRTTQEGKVYYRYLSKLTKKDGSTLVAQVRFKGFAPRPEDCPMNIEFDKPDANLALRTYVRKDTGELANGWTLWVNEWSLSGKYIDTSLEEFE